MDSHESSEPQASASRDALELVATGLGGAGPSLLDLVLPGAGAALGGATALIGLLLGRHADRQTTKLIDDLQSRVVRLEAAGKFDRERAAHWEDAGALRAVAQNAISVPEKTAYYADLLVGTVSTDTEEEIDLESLLDTLDSLSVQEIDLARGMYDAWEETYGATPTAPGGRGSGQVQPQKFGPDSEYQLKRLEGAGLIVPDVRTGPTGAGLSTKGYELTTTLVRLMRLLRSGRAGESE